MKWPGDPIRARLVKRYKRFLADFVLEDGQTVTAHCANTGSMKTCLADDAPSILTFHDNPKRKLKYSWHALEMPDGWVGINTAMANGLVVEAIENGTVTELAGYATLRTERKYGTSSRIDILLSDSNRPDCYVEVKNATLLLEEEVVAFPDAVTTRGLKHLRELMAMVEQGHRSVLMFCVQRASGSKVVPADAFDPEYGKTLRQAVAAGVEVLAYQADFGEEGVRLVRSLPVDLTEPSC